MSDPAGKWNEGCALLAGALLGAACDPSNQSISLTWPKLQPGATAVVIALNQDQPIAQRVIEESHEGQVMISIPTGAEALEFYGLEYPSSAMRLGLPPGALELGMGRSLPPPGIIHHARLTVARTEAWQPVAELPDVLSGLHLAQAAEDACALGFSPRIVDYELPGAPEDGLAVTATKISADTALVLLRQGQAYRVTSDGAVADPTLTSSTALYLGGGRIRTAENRGDEEIWIRRTDGMFRGHPSRGFNAVPNLAAPVLTRTWLAPRKRPDGVEVLSLTDLGSIDRFDGHTWSHVTDVPVIAVENVHDVSGGIFWTQAPDTAIVMKPVFYPCERADVLSCGRGLDQDGKIWFLKGDRLEEAPMLPDQPSSLWVSNGGAIYVPTLGGRLFQLVEGAWIEVASAGQRIISVYDVSWGLLVGLPRAELGGIQPFLGYCSQPLRIPGGIRQVAEVSDGVVLARQRDVISLLGGNYVSFLEPN